MGLAFVKVEGSASPHAGLPLPTPAPLANALPVLLGAVIADPCVEVAGLTARATKPFLHPLKLPHALAAHPLLSGELGQRHLVFAVGHYAAAATLTTVGREPKAKDLSSLEVSKVAVKVTVSLRSMPELAGTVTHTRELFSSLTSILRVVP